MDPRRSGQDVLRCDLCETPLPSLHCDNCHVNLCKPCVGEHVSDESKEHRVVLFKKRGSTPKCLKHSSKICELHCEQCHSPICAICVSSFDHEQHLKVDIFKKFEDKKAALRKDLQELENSICPKYQKIISDIPIQRKAVNMNSQNLKAAINKQGQNLHREINGAIEKIKADVDDMNYKHLANLQKRDDEIKCSIAEMKQNIVDMKKLLDSYDVCHVCAYKSKNVAYRRLPPKLTVFLPKFIPLQIGEAEVIRQVGVLLELRVRTEEYDLSSTSLEVVSSLPKKPLIDYPMIISEMFTAFRNNKNLLNFTDVCCVNDKEIWMSGCDEFIRLYNLEGQFVKSIQTKSGKVPIGITIIRFGDLIYADKYDASLNIVKGTQIQTLIRFRSCQLHGLCSTSSDDLLLVMASDYNNQTKVVRYSDFTEKQIIQFDNKGQPLYSSPCSFPTCICENTNFDICVADNVGNAVVVVNQNGEFRFRYPEYLGPFQPFGIATDSQSRILTSDGFSGRIHILNQDGQFLRYVNDSTVYLQCPQGLCVDNNDNLFVAEKATGKVKKIQYCNK